MKPIKVFFMGEHLRDIYPHATRWQVIKYRTARFFRKLALGTLTIIALFATIQIARYAFPVTVYANKNVDVSDVEMAKRIDSLKDDVVAKLAACESAGLTEDQGIIIFDSNSKASIGQLQFQKKTVIHYYKVLYGKDITGKEAVMIALDTDKASQLAKDIIFKTKNKAGMDWVNCTKKHNLDSQVDLIKKLENN